jgi:hypothetical protein
MLLRIRDLFAVDFVSVRDICVRPESFSLGYLTGSSSVSQKDLSITVTTRPGCSGVPR